MFWTYETVAPGSPHFMETSAQDLVTSLKRVTNAPSELLRSQQMSTLCFVFQNENENQNFPTLYYLQ